MQKNKYLKTFINVMTVVIITVVVLYISLKDQYTKIVSILSSVPYIYLLSCLVLTLIWLYLISYNLKILARIYYKQYRETDSFINCASATLFNNITPSSTGGQIVQFQIFKKQGLDSSCAASVLAIDFLIYQVVLVTISIVLFLININFILSNYIHLFPLYLIGLFINLCVLLSILLFSKNYKIHKFLCKIISSIGYKLKLVKDKQQFVLKIDQGLNKFRNQIIFMKHHKIKVLKVFISNVFRMLIFYSIPFVIILSFQFDITIKDYFLILSMTSFIYVVSNMIPLPGAAGGIETVFFIVYSIYCPNYITIAIMILWRIFTYYLPTFISLLIYSIYNFKVKRSLQI